MAKEYKHAPPFDSGTLKVGSIHTLHYDQYGKQDGKPVIFLHGGPGGSTSIGSTVFFDPEVYRVVCLDQRGAGKSRPVAEIKENTSQHLVADIEALRTHLKIPKWHMVFGGSWGSTLALMYAQAHPQMVGSLVLRGIFAGRKMETDFLWTSTTMLFPEAFEEMMQFLPPEKRATPEQSFFESLLSDDPETKKSAARAWNKFEFTVSQIDTSRADLSKLDDDDFSLQHARLERHYFTNNLFIEEGELLRQENVKKIRHIPGSIVQGRYDLVCPPQTAWDLHKAWPESELHMIPMSGHTAKEPGIMQKLIEVCDEYAKLDLA